ncbi:hypothetical protein C8J57DRAFT_1307330, partial [Mycena rebaudengoi]
MMHLQAYIVRALFSLFSESHCSPGYRTRSSCPHLFYISFRSAVPSTLILLISSFSRCRSLVQTSRDARTLSLRISTNLSCGHGNCPKRLSDVLLIGWTLCAAPIGATRLSPTIRSSMQFKMLACVAHFQGD